MSEVFSGQLTAALVNAFPVATFEETWACFEVYRRWNYCADDIYVVLRRFPAPHVCVVLMAPGTRCPLYDLYAGRLVDSEAAFLSGWRTFAAKSAAGGFTQDEFEKMWRASRVFNSSVEVATSMTLAGLQVQP